MTGIRDFSIYKDSIVMGANLSRLGGSHLIGTDVLGASLIMTERIAQYVELEYVGGVSAYNPNTTTYTITLPAGMQEGDFVFVYTGVGYDTDRDRVISPSGYTQIARPLLSGITWGTFNYLGYKFMGSTPDTSITLAASASYPADYPSTAVIHVWRGVDTDDPLDVTISSALGQGPGNRSVVAGPIAPVTPGAVILAMCSLSDASVGYTPTPGPEYENTVQVSRYPSAGYAMCLSSVLWDGGGVDAETWSGLTLTERSPATPNSWNGVMLALRPATQE